MTDAAPEREIVAFPKKFDKKGVLLESQGAMMKRALEMAREKGHQKISVQTEDEKEWTVLFYS